MFAYILYYPYQLTRLVPKFWCFSFSTVSLEMTVVTSVSSKNNHFVGSTTATDKRELQRQVVMAIIIFFLFSLPCKLASPTNCKLIQYHANISWYSLKAFETQSSKLLSIEVRVECIEYTVECFKFRDKKQITFHVIIFSHVLSESPQSHFVLQ